ncbi:MAG: MBL fold metallo-hydrolase [Candidatus Paceibacterota bacterium]|jgi:metallo-beta-lactamase family protein
MSAYSLRCCSGVGNATGANFLLKTPNLSILVDCGLIQGSHEAMEENRLDFTYDPSQIDYLLVTHAHMDHIGRIPKLVKAGFMGTIYSTLETKEISALMLEDAQALMARDALERHIEPMYEKADLAQAFSLWKTIPYHENFNLADDVSLYWKDSGHILGAAIIEVTLPKAKIAFTGDLGNSPSPLLRDTEFVTDADYMVMESVYGDRNHESKEQRDIKFRQILAETLGKGGTVIIPTFSIERTQVILFELNALVEARILPRVPIFLDSPLATKVTEVYRRHTEEFNAGTRAIISGGDDIFSFPGLKVVESPQESQALDRIHGPKIILAGSGMSVGGRVLRHEVAFLGDPLATILLVGYQVAGSVGRQIEDKRPSVNINGTVVRIRARIEKVGGYSSHKDSNNLVDFVSHALPRVRQVFVAMGENKSSTFLAQRLRSELGANAIVPERDREYDLDIVI